MLFGWEAARRRWRAGRRARRNITGKASASRERLNMPFEAALCLRGLGDTNAAKEILGRIGCVPWLEFTSGGAGP